MQQFEAADNGSVCCAAHLSRCAAMSPSSRVRCLSSSLMAASSPSSSTTWQQQQQRHLAQLLDHASADTCAQHNFWKIFVHK
jgi:hypothetical protein